jgi:hypothetical protein
MNIFPSYFYQLDVVFGSGNLEQKVRTFTSCTWCLVWGILNKRHCKISSTYLEVLAPSSSK